MRKIYQSAKSWLKNSEDIEESYSDYYGKGLSLLEKLILPIPGSAAKISFSKLKEKPETKEAYFKGFSGYSEKQGRHTSNRVNELAEIVSEVSPKIAHKGLISIWLSKRYFPYMHLLDSLEEAGITAETPELPLILSLKLLLDVKIRSIKPINDKIKMMLSGSRIYLNPECSFKFFQKAEYYRGFSDLIQKEINTYAEKNFGKKAEKALRLWKTILFLSTSFLKGSRAELQKPIFSCLAQRKWEEAESLIYETAKAHPEIFKDFKLKELKLKELIPEKEKKRREIKTRIHYYERKVKKLLKEGMPLSALNLASARGFKDRIDILYKKIVDEYRTKEIIYSPKGVKLIFSGIYLDLPDDVKNFYDWLKKRYKKEGLGKSLENLETQLKRFSEYVFQSSDLNECFKEVGLGKKHKIVYFLEHYLDA